MTPPPLPQRQPALLAALTRNRGELDAETLGRLLLAVAPAQPARPR